jgi:hypothetical protein
MAGARRPDVTAIPLGRPSPGASSNQPERQGQRTRPRDERAARRSYSVLLPAGLAVPLALPPARCALTAPFHPCRNALASRPAVRRFAFCGAFPGVAPAGHYPAPHPYGARTFLRPFDRLRRRRPSGRLADAGIWGRGGGGQEESGCGGWKTRRGPRPRGTNGMTCSLKLHWNYGNMAAAAGERSVASLRLLGNRGATKRTF